MTDDDLEAAWDAVHNATPEGRAVGQPSYHDERHEWIQYCYDAHEVPNVGVRSREWTAVGGSKLEVLVETARCLHELGEGRTPK